MQTINSRRTGDKCGLSPFMELSKLMSGKPKRNNTNVIAAERYSAAPEQDPKGSE